MSGAVAQRPARWLSARELMAEFSVSRTGVYRVARQVHTTKVPGVGLRFLRSDVEALFDAGLRAPALAPEGPTGSGPRGRRSRPPKPAEGEADWIADARRFGLW